MGAKMTLALNHEPPAMAGRYGATTTDDFADFGDYELRCYPPSGLCFMAPAQERNVGSQARVVAAAWLLSIGAVSPTDAASWPMSPKPASTTWGEDLAPKRTRN